MKPQYLQGRCCDGLDMRAISVWDIYMAQGATKGDWASTRREARQNKGGPEPRATCRLSFCWVGVLLNCFESSMPNSLDIFSASENSWYNRVLRLRRCNLTFLNPAHRTLDTSQHQSHACEIRAINRKLLKNYFICAVKKDTYTIVDLALLRRQNVSFVQTFIHVRQSQVTDMKKLMHAHARRGQACAMLRTPAPLHRPSSINTINPTLHCFKDDDQHAILLAIALCT